MEKSRQYREFSIVLIIQEISSRIVHGPQMKIRHTRYHKSNVFKRNSLVCTTLPMPHRNRQKCSGRSNVLSEGCHSAPFGKSHVPSQFRTWVSVPSVSLRQSDSRNAESRSSKQGVKDMKIERYCPVWSWRRCRYSPLKRTFVPWAKGKEMEQRA